MDSLKIRKDSIPKKLRLPVLDGDLQSFELFLTVEDLADRWRLKHKGTLRNWRSQKKGPPWVKLPSGEVIYPVSGVLKYERENYITENRRTRRLDEAP